MDCNKHNKPMQQVCGEFKCGLCYEESLSTERHVPVPDWGPFPTKLFVHKFNGHGQKVKK